MARETYVQKRLPSGDFVLVPRSQLSAWMEKHYPDRKGSIIRFRKIERGSWVWRDGKVVPKYLAPKKGAGYGLQVIKDIEPYRNIAVDNKVVSGRRQHRDMMRAHGLIEVGSEPHNKPRQPPPDRVDMSLVNDIKRAMGKL